MRKKVVTEYLCMRKWNWIELFYIYSFFNKQGKKTEHIIKEFSINYPSILTEICLDVSAANYHHQLCFFRKYHLLVTFKDKNAQIEEFAKIVVLKNSWYIHFKYGYLQLFKKNYIIKVVEINILQIGCFT